MDYFKLQDEIENLYPGKNATVVLDEECVKRYEIEKQGQKFLRNGFVVYGHAKVKISGEPDRLIPIDDHRAVEPVGTVISRIPRQPDIVEIPDRR